MACACRNARGAPIGTVWSFRQEEFNGLRQRCVFSLIRVTCSPIYNFSSDRNCPQVFCLTPQPPLHSSQRSHGGSSFRVYGDNSGGGDGGGDGLPGANRNVGDVVVELAAGCIFDAVGSGRQTGYRKALRARRLCHKHISPVGVDEGG